MALPLIRDEIVHAALVYIDMFRQIAGISMDEFTPELFFDKESLWNRLGPVAKEAYPDAIDFAVTMSIARNAQTFLFDSGQIMAFMRAIDRRLSPGDYYAPFETMIVQFTEPIPEREFLTGYGTGGWTASSENDFVKGLVIGFPREKDEVALINAVAWFASTSVNRVAAEVDGNGEISHRFMEGASTPAGIQDKQRILNLAMLCLAYLNSPGIETLKVEAPPAINKRRIKDGKKPIGPYYVCRLAKGRSGPGEGEPTGKHVSFRFDVRGYFRPMPNGKTIWVRAHQRGLANERYVPKVYKVEGRKNGPE